MSRLAAVSLLAAAIGLCYLMVVGPLWLAYTEKADDIERNRLLLGKYAAHTVVAVSPDQPGPALFCSGKTEALVLAGLQGVLQSMASTHGVTLRSVQPLAKASSGTLSLAGLGLDLTGDFPRVQDLIYAIETASPTLLIRQTEIRRTTSATPELAASNMVDVQMHVYCAVDGKE